MQRMRSPSPIVWPVAITGGFLAAQFALRGQSGFADSLHTFLQPHEAVDWLPHIVLLALGVSIVMYFAPAHRPRLIALAAALCLAAPVRLLSGNLAQHWSIPGKVAVLVSLAAVLGVVWLLLASNDDEQPAILRVPLANSRRGGHRHRGDPIRRAHLRPLIRRPRRRDHGNRARILGFAGIASSCGVACRPARRHHVHARQPHHPRPLLRRAQHDQRRTAFPSLAATAAPLPALLEAARRGNETRPASCLPITSGDCCRKRLSA